MRADRLISLLLQLQMHGTLTAQALAVRLGVSKRTVYRDIEALSLAGIPVYARPGTDGGVSLDEDYRFSLHLITRAETQALAISAGAGALSDLGLKHASEDALLKLLATLPAILREEAHRTRQLVYIDPEGWFDEEDPVPLLPVLQRAVWEDQVLGLTYQHGDGHVVERVVEAWSLVAKGGAWYLLGRSLEEPSGSAQPPQLRTYRAARILAAVPREGAFIRPADFDLPAYWTEHSRAFVQGFTGDREPFEAVLRVRERSLWPLVKGMSGRYTREPGDCPTGWVTLRMSFTDRFPARVKALSLGVDVEVLAPDDFRAEVAQVLAGMMSLYHSTQSTG